MESTTCSLTACDRQHYGLGLCSAHYQQRRAGIPLKPVRASGRRGDSLQDRLDAHTDKSGACWVWTGSRQQWGHGKLRNHLTGKTVLAHRLSYELAFGPIPAGMEIDHKCRNPPCVNPDHLQLATSRENKENRSGAQPGNASGVQGVSWHRGRWRVRVQHGGKSTYGGRFSSLAEAEKTAIALRMELHTNNLRDRE